MGDIKGLEDQKIGDIKGLEGIGGLSGIEGLKGIETGIKEIQEGYGDDEEEEDDDISGYEDAQVIWTDKVGKFGHVSDIKELGDFEAKDVIRKQSGNAYGLDNNPKRSQGNY